MADHFKTGYVGVPLTQLAGWSFTAFYFLLSRPLLCDQSEVEQLIGKLQTFHRHSQIATLVN